MKRIALCMVLLICTACSNGAELKQTTLTKENLVTVQKRVNSGKGVSTEEAQWYLLGQIQITSSGGQVVGKTVTEVIAAGKTVPVPKQ
jgi:hypothetical protein